MGASDGVKQHYGIQERNLLSSAVLCAWSYERGQSPGSASLVGAETSVSQIHCQTREIGKVWFMVIVLFFKGSMIRKNKTELKTFAFLSVCPS